MLAFLLWTDISQVINHFILLLQNVICTFTENIIWKFLGSNVNKCHLDFFFPFWRLENI